MTKVQLLKTSKAKRFQYLFMRHPLTILFGYIFIFLFGMCIYPFSNQPRQHFDSLIAFLAHIGLGISLTCLIGWPALVLAIIVPHLIASAIGALPVLCAAQLSDGVV
jgi:omega-6 fatty acid desaturase (delta-12 desaturase)